MEGREGMEGMEKMKGGEGVEKMKGAEGIGTQLESADIRMGKARFCDWEDMYRNIWSRPETARYMLWKVTDSEEAARERMQKSIEFQSSHDAWLVYEKKSGQAVGFAGMTEKEPGVWEDTGIALGPDFVGRGYGKQILLLLLAYCKNVRGGREFCYSTRAANKASIGLALSCGFSYQYSEQRTDPRSGEPYEVEFYRKALAAEEESI